MTQATVTLAEFLLARIAEDEAAFGGASVHWDEIENWLIRADEDDAPVVFTERRALAECEAKRLIIGLHAADRPYPSGNIAIERLITHDGKSVRLGEVVPACRVCVRFHADMDCENEKWPCQTIRALALPYSQHPDYRQEWTP